MEWRRWIPAFWVLVLTVPGWAADLYVDNTVATSAVYDPATRTIGSGTEQVYATCQEVANVVNAGDTVYFRAGTYWTATNASTPVMRLLRSGTVEAPITFQNYNGEEAILSGVNAEGTPTHQNVWALGTKASTVNHTGLSGLGVHDIIISGLIFQYGTLINLAIYGEVNHHGGGVFVNPAKNITVTHCLFRWGSGTNGTGQGVSTVGRAENVIIEYCEAYENSGTGLFFGRLSKSYDGCYLWDAGTRTFLPWDNPFYSNHVPPTPKDQMSAAYACIMRHNWTHQNMGIISPGNSDGIGGSNMYQCTFEDNISWNDSDDGIDIYASEECLIQRNLSFDHNTDGGNCAGLKFSAGGGGHHTVRENVIVRNHNSTYEQGIEADPDPSGTAMETSDASASYRKTYHNWVYHNTAYNHRTGLSVADEVEADAPILSQYFIRNNVLADNRGGENSDLFGWSGYEETDSDYNYLSLATNLTNLQAVGLDDNSTTGDPLGLTSPDTALDLDFPDGYTIEQKLAYLRAQVQANFAPTAAGNLIDGGVVIAGYHNAEAGDGPLHDWYGAAPDLGAYEYVGSVVPGQATAPSPANAATDVATSVTLSWTAGASAISYEVYLDTVTPPVALLGSPAVVSIPSGTMLEDTLYYWRVDSINGENTTAGTIWSFTTEAEATLPGKATSPSPGDTVTGQATSLTLSWSPVVGANTYSIYRNTSNSFGPGQLLGTQAGVSIASGTLTGGTLYYWRVDTTNEGGTTTGDVWTFTTLSGLTGPTTPGPATAAVRTSFAPTLSWAAVEGAESYTIYFGTSADFDIENPYATQAGTSLNVPDLDSHETYYWRVYATDSYGSIGGDVWTFTTKRGYVMVRK
jgi:hypothetical protein